MSFLQGLYSTPLLLFKAWKAGQSSAQIGPRPSFFCFLFIFLTCCAKTAGLLAMSQVARLEPERTGRHHLRWSSGVIDRLYHEVTLRGARLKTCRAATRNQHGMRVGSTSKLKTSPIVERLFSPAQLVVTDCFRTQCICTIELRYGFDGFGRTVKQSN